MKTGNFFKQLTMLLTLLANMQAMAQPAPHHWTVKPGTLIYLDGQPSTLATINQVPNGAIAIAEGFTRCNFHMGAPAILRALGDTTAIGALIITTKVNERAPATLALADRADLPSAYTQEVVTVNTIAPIALAYITSHYPKCWLDGKVQKLTRKSTGEVKYKVWLADNWGCRSPCFTEDGKFVND